MKPQAPAHRVIPRTGLLYKIWVSTVFETWFSEIQKASEPGTLIRIHSSLSERNLESYLAQLTKAVLLRQLLLLVISIINRTLHATYFKNIANLVHSTRHATNQRRYGNSAKVPLYRQRILWQYIGF
jgi:hypothetical protein